MVGGLATRTTGIVLDVARQRGGAMPGIVTLHDHSRFGNDGAMTDITWTQLPSGLWVMNFDTVTDYITITTPPSILFTHHDFSGECWYYPNALTAVDYLALRGWFMTDGWAWCVNADGKPIFQTNQGGAVQQTEGADGDIAVGQWYHMVFTRSGANANIFRNAIDITDVVGAHLDPADASARDFYIGTNGLAPISYIGLYRLYCYALTPAQIRAKFTATRRYFGV